MHDPNRLQGGPGYQRPPYPPPHHDTYVVQQAGSRGRRETSVNAITVPLLLVCSFAVFLVGATYLATSQFADIKYEIVKLSDKVQAMTGELSARIGRLEQDQSGNHTKRDHEIWCAKAERANQASGWSCGDTPAARAPVVQGWQTRAK